MWQFFDSANTAFLVIESPSRIVDTRLFVKYCEESFIYKIYVVDVFLDIFAHADKVYQFYLKLKVITK